MLRLKVHESKNLHTNFKEKQILNELQKLNNHLPFPGCVHEELVQCLFALVGNSSFYEKRITQENTEKLQHLWAMLCIQR